MPRSNICQCFDVSKSEVRKAIKSGHDSVEKLSEHLQVGNRCGGCIDSIEEMIENTQNGVFVCIFRRK